MLRRMECEVRDSAKETAMTTPALTVDPTHISQQLHSAFFPEMTKVHKHSIFFVQTDIIFWWCYHNLIPTSQGTQRLFIHIFCPKGLKVFLNSDNEIQIQIQVRESDVERWFLRPALAARICRPLISVDFPPWWQNMDIQIMEEIQFRTPIVFEILFWIILLFVIDSRSPMV